MIGEITTDAFLISIFSEESNLIDCICRFQ